MKIITKRPMILGTVKIDIGTPLTVPDGIGSIMVVRTLAEEIKKGRKKK